MNKKLQTYLNCTYLPAYLKAVRIEFHGYGEVSSNVKLSEVANLWTCPRLLFRQLWRTLNPYAPLQGLDGEPWHNSGARRHRAVETVSKLFPIHHGEAPAKRRLPLLGNHGLLANSPNLLIRIISSPVPPTASLRPSTIL